jgi:hypothetical protein
VSSGTTATHDADVIFEDVLAVSDGLTLMCEIGTRRHSIPHHLVRIGSEVRKKGDRGRLVIPESLARDLGLAPPK